MRTCTMPGCDKAHRARGLCATHYNQQHQPNRHAKVSIPCTYCGTPCMKDVSNTRQGRFCSFICRDLYLMEHSKGAWAVRKPRAPKVKVLPTLCLLVESACHVCGLVFFHRPSKRLYCSKQCGTKAHDAKHSIGRAARHKIRRIAIFERDGYVCWMCEKVCDPTLSVPHPDAATVDHLTPQSLGGTHDPGNLATACFICNSTRGASWSFPISSAA